MSDVSPSGFGETPAVEVRICRGGNEVDVERANAYPRDVILRPEDYGG